MELTLRDAAMFLGGFVLGASLPLLARFFARGDFARPAGSGGGGYNFTQRVREALAAAREEAAKLGQGSVGTEHILLGILDAPPGVAVAVLTNLKVDLAQLRASVLTLAPSAAGQPTGPDLPYRWRAKKVLEKSMAAARDLKHNYVGTEHMLLGLLREGDGIAAKALANAGVTLDNATTAVLNQVKK